VSSLTQQIAEPKVFRIESGQPMRSSTVNVVMSKYPDGNSIAFAEALDANMAQQYPCLPTQQLT
jgi:hypothetical protein